jgi:transcriptional regulator with XRE-family HTH domain
MLMFGHGGTISAIADASSDSDSGRAMIHFYSQNGCMSGAGWRQRLRAAIDRDGRSMRDVSLAAGLSHGYVHGILQDDKEPTLDRFLKVCETLGVSATHILVGSEVTPATERIVEALEKEPAMRDAILALLRRTS